MKQSLNKIAGTSEIHYNDYKKQVFEFSDKWRNYLVPMLFKEQKFTMLNFKELPRFNYRNNVKNDTLLSVLVLILLSTIIFLQFSLRNLKNKSTQSFVD